MRTRLSGLIHAGFLCIIALSFVSGVCAQAIWVEDASIANIVTRPVSGQVSGQPFTLKFGTLKKTGGIEFGDATFDHYTIALQDDESPFRSRFGLDLIVTVPRGTLPDSKTYRYIRSSVLADQPGPGRKDQGILALPEFYSLRMSSSKGFGESTNILSSGPYQQFTGRIELGARKADRITVGLYVCFNDPDKSCAGGTAELSIR